ncbi:MAG: sterol desaturase family protein, partial [Verrucomicrobia bacterium]|nr:sterol desaturase family protein [Verrucomicrobiota bacterium]
ATAGLYVMNHASHLLLLIIVNPFAYFIWSYRLTTIPLDTAWGVALLFLGVDLVYYWSHRAAHEIRWMCANHVVHHTAEKISLPVGLRVGCTELLSGIWLIYVPLYLLGFNPAAATGMLALNKVYMIWLHTDFVGRLGPLEWVLNTPSHHCLHHASNSEYLDRNYGGILIIWDRLFGTFVREKPQTETAYGLVHPIGSLNPIKIAFHEMGRLGA